MNYSLVSPEDFTSEQTHFIEGVKNSVKMGHCPLILIPEIRFGIKDIHSKFIVAKDYDAKLCGLAHAEDLIGLGDGEVPCKIAEFAQDFIDEDRELLSYREDCKQQTMLNIGEYATGLESFISYKYPLKHEPTQSILGITYTACKIDLSYFVNILPNYLLEFGGGSLGHVEDQLKIGDLYFTPHEHEIGFLTTMNWDGEQIASFMNKHRPLPAFTTTEIVSKHQDEICKKLGCTANELRDRLIDIDFHRKMPNFLFTQLIGNRLVS